MGVVVLVLLTVTFAWTLVSGGVAPFHTERAQIHHYWFESGRSLKRMFEYEPPERKAVVVDISGMSYRSADGSQMTKRDRSRPFPRLDAQFSSETMSARTGPELVALSPAPLGQGQIEEIPMASPVLSKPPALSEASWSLGRRVQTALKASNLLSRSAQVTLRAVSMRDRVTLSGIVLDQEEKDRIGAKAEEIVGSGRVDNRLTVL